MIIVSKLHTLVYVSGLKDFRYPQKSYRHWTIIISARGRFAFSIGEAKGECQEGSFVLTPPNTLLKRTMLEPVDFAFAEFNGRGSDAKPIKGGLHRMSDWARVRSSLGHWQRAARHPQDYVAGRHLVQDCFFCAALEQDSTSAKDPLMERARHLLEIGWNQPLNIAATARALRITPFALSRRFHNAHGLAPREFVIQLRLEKACGLLIETDWKLQRIAEACGWSNAFYVSRLFNQRVGQPPSRFRREKTV